MGAAREAMGRGALGRHLQLALYLLRRPPQPGRAWAERPTGMLIETLRFFLAIPAGAGATWRRTTTAGRIRPRHRSRPTDRTAGALPRRWTRGRTGGLGADADGRRVRIGRVYPAHARPAAGAVDLALLLGRRRSWSVEVWATDGAPS